MHREAAGSARLHLFQELSTLGQQLAHSLLPGSGLGRIKDHASSMHAATAPALRPKQGALTPRAST